MMSGRHRDVLAGPPPSRPARLRPGWGWEGLFVLCLAVAPVGSAAQTRTVAGRVTEWPSGRAVSGGTVAVAGTTTQDVLRADGVFVLRAPEGPLTLIITVPGYATVTTPVDARQEVVLVALQREPVRLAAFAAGAERGRPGSRPGVAGEETARVPSESFVDGLGSKLAGTVVSQSSGAPAGLRQIQVRGISTLLGNTAPLVVVDGIVIQSTGGIDGANLVTGGLPRNADRLVDLSPYDIESVELLKGAAATLRYGSRAANGVLVITTRHR